MRLQRVEGFSANERTWNRTHGLARAVVFSHNRAFESSSRRFETPRNNRQRLRGLQS